MFADIENESDIIDIDQIKDEQNPIYKRIDIHRQRVIYVLDRALEKLCIAYVLEELLTENLNLVSKYITKGEIDSILRDVNYTKHSVEGPENIGYIASTVLKRSALLKKSGFYSKSGYLLPSSSSMQTDMPFASDKSCSNSLPSQLQRSYYSSIIVKLQYVPEIRQLAKAHLNKRPLKTITYYVYLKDLRDHLIKLIYQTKTDEIDYNKRIKNAYVRNIELTDQVKALQKNLQDRKRETRELETQINEAIENEKLIQTKMNLELIEEATELIEISEEEIIDKTNASNDLLEVKKTINTELQTYYNKELNDNILAIQKLRNKVKKTEVNLKKILEEYDVTIGELNERYEEIYETYEVEEKKYNALKIKFDRLELEYVPMMAEKKHYMEMAQLRIRYNRATRIVQRWWRAILIRRWKWRKTFLANQIKRRDISKSQRIKILKNLKNIRKRQKRMDAKFKSPK